MLAAENPSFMFPFQFPAYYPLSSDGYSEEEESLEEMKLEPLFDGYVNYDEKLYSSTIKPNKINIGSNQENFSVQGPLTNSFEIDLSQFSKDSEMKVRRKKEKNHDDKEPKKRGRPPKNTTKLGKSGKESNLFEEIPIEDEEDDLKKKRGRPPKILGSSPSSETDLSQKRKKKKLKNHSPQLYKRVASNSVRSIPCFYCNCTYNYKRPGSTIVEISDRPLLLSEKFDGFTIRSCKKHHDKWKATEKHGSTTCEICRGVNVTDEKEKHQAQQYTNSSNMTFVLCRPCAERQSGTLGLSVIPSGVLPNPETCSPIESPTQMKASTPHEEKIVEEGKDNSLPKVHSKKSEPNTELSSESEASEEYFDGSSESDSSDSVSGGSDTEIRQTKRPKVEEFQTIIVQPKHAKKYHHRMKRFSLDNSNHEPNSSSTVQRSSSLEFPVEPIHDSHKRFIRQPQPSNLEIIRSLSQKVAKGKFAVFRRSSPPLGWNQFATGVRYLTNLGWSESLLEKEVSKPTKIEERGTPPFEVSIRISPYTSGPGLFAGSQIPEGTCIGEFTGQVSQNITFSRFSYRLMDDIEVDASESGNEFRFVNDAFNSRRDGNIIFENVDGHILAIATRQIEFEEELLVDYGDDYRDRVSMYIEIFDQIHQYNLENLSEEERKNSAFDWFISEGYKVLKQKSKITIPIQNRIPAKKGMANTLGNSRSPLKHENEWGYVAHIEKLDLDRAREDCWVSFKPGRYWNCPAFESALNFWKFDKNHKPETNFEAKKPAFFFEKEEKVNVGHDSWSTKLSAINFEELSIQESRMMPYGRLESNGAFVHKASWRGFPVAVRFPKMEMPQSEEEKTFEIQKRCAIAQISHPNIVSCYGCSSSKDRFCTVMEFMNLGNLQRWVTQLKPSLLAKHIPRIATDIARAMEHLHAKGIVYGKLKSSNILMKGVMHDHEIISFEVKIDVDPSMQMSTTEEQMGLFLPSQDDHKIAFGKDPAMDVYSFGMILSHLFSDGQDLPKRPKEVCKTSIYLQQWDPKWRELIVDCTQTDPSERPVTFSSILSVLMQLNKQMGISPNF